jgi:hypothetical protein
MKTVSTERSAMNDDTRKLLKIFGVAVTDSEAEAEKLVARALQLSTNSNKADTMNTAQEKP